MIRMRNMLMNKIKNMSLNINQVLHLIELARLSYHHKRNNSWT
jgi:hypothetical protein